MTWQIQSAVEQPYLLCDPPRPRCNAAEEIFSAKRTDEAACAVTTAVKVWMEDGAKAEKKLLPSLAEEKRKGTSRRGKLGRDKSPAKMARNVTCERRR